MTDDTKPEKKTTMIRLPQSLYNAIAKRARKRLRSVNNEMVVLLKIGLANETDEVKALKSAEELIKRAAGPGEKIQ
jgi:hypothetical protein